MASKHFAVKEQSLRNVITSAGSVEIAVPGLMSALGYF